MKNSIQVTDLVKQAARDAGFELVGIAPVYDFDELDRFREWIAAGRAGEMKYMEARDEAGNLRRSSLRSTVPWARSVIVCAINYNTAHPYSTQVHDPERGWIARYAWGQEDYHDAVIRRLRVVEDRLRRLFQKPPRRRCKPGAMSIPGRLSNGYMQSTPGVGWIGKNTCILNQKMGSWLFLGVILTSLELEPDLPAPDRCGTCTRCIDACPTDALIAPYQLDSNLCISYLTIEKRGAIPEEMREGMGRHVFGCDICQDVCPWNRKAPVTNAVEFQARDGLVNPALEWLAEMTAEEFREKFRGSAVRRTKRSGLRRNAVIAMGNSGDRRFKPLLEKLRSDEDPVVAECADWGQRRFRRRNDLVSVVASSASVFSSGWIMPRICFTSRLIVSLLICASSVCFAEPAPATTRTKDAKWLRINSAHFSVLTDAGEPKGRETATRLEQMRDVFAQLFRKTKLRLPRTAGCDCSSKRRRIYPAGPTSSGTSHLRAWIFFAWRGSQLHRARSRRRGQLASGLTRICTSAFEFQLSPDAGLVR